MVTGDGLGVAAPVRARAAVFVFAGRAFRLRAADFFLPEDFLAEAFRAEAFRVDDAFRFVAFFFLAFAMALPLLV